MSCSADCRWKNCPRFILEDNCYTVYSVITIGINAIVIIFVKYFIYISLGNKIEKRDAAWDISSDSTLLKVTDI